MKPDGARVSLHKPGTLADVFEREEARTNNPRADVYRASPRMSWATVPRELQERFKDLAAELGVPASRLVTEALRSWLDATPAEMTGATPSGGGITSGPDVAARTCPRKR
jgi:hypothetical protein